MNFSQKKIILIASHDAGGAEIISSWVYHHRKHQYKFFLEGPAIKIFLKKLPNTQLFDRTSLLKEVIESDFVLTGSGWGSDLENMTIALAKEKCKPVATYLDHWTSYSERFLYKGSLNLPDEIWLGDKFAMQIAENIFGPRKIKEVPNLYFKDIVKQIRRIPEHRKEFKFRVLYVCEPKSVASAVKYGDPYHFGYTEYEALENYLNYLETQKENLEAILLRPHPSESSDKYKYITEKFQEVFKILEWKGTSLAEDCAWADWVVGCDSMAMAVGLLAGKNVFSCIPKGGRPLTLPYPEIIKLFNDNREPTS